MSKNVLVAHDSEVFARDRRSGMLIPLIGRIGGTKNNPVIIKHGNLQEDNVSGEIAIDPCKTADEFVDNTYKVLSVMEDIIKKMGCDMIIKDSVDFNMGVLFDHAPDSFACGCDPDYNIYSNSKNEYPSLEETTTRTGSGHIHFDIDSAEEYPEKIKEFVALCDIYIKIPLSVKYGITPRDDTYGRLGNYRPKPYGAEYRSPSNVILGDKKTLRYVFERIQFIHRQYDRGVRAHKEDVTAMWSLLRSNHRDKLNSFLEHYGVKPCS